jgi:hypothetical protein
MATKGAPATFAAAYPNIAHWISDFGWIELGQDGYSTSLVRALDEGGMIWESSERYQTLDEALKALDNAIAAWFQENGFSE